jgi:hypothetical protein
MPLQKITQILIIFLFFRSLVSSTPYIGIKLFTSEIGIEDFSSLEKNLYKRLIREALPRDLKPVLLDKTPCDSCEVLVSGEFIKRNDNLIFHLNLENTIDFSQESKVIPLSKKTPDDVIEMLVITINRFLEQSISGKLRISSVPLDCDIFLNGMKIGKTPAELVLEHGNYRINLEHEYLYPFSDSIQVISGKQVNLETTMRFRGYNCKPWITGSTVLTLLSAVAWVTEYRFHKSYLSLDKNSQQDIFDRYYNRYRTANYIKIGLLNGTALGLTISGYLVSRNHSLKSKIFDEKQ